MRLSKWSFVFAVLFIGVLSGCAGHSVKPSPAISETDDLNAVIDAAGHFSQHYTADEILVVFDLDNTLLTMDSSLGSVAWYDWQAEMADIQGCQPGELQNRFAAQGLLYFLGSMQPLQSNTADIVADLQLAGYPVMVLTARGADYYLQTLRELARNRLSFAPLSNIAPEHRAEPYMPSNGKRPVLYQQGVLMVAGQNKGEMLLDLYDKLGLALPKAVVMADDSLDNLVNMQASLKQTGIPHRLVRYNHSDSKVAAFDPISTGAQWRQLMKTLDVQRAVIAASNFPEHVELADCSD